MTITLSEVTTDVQTYGKQEYDRAWLTQQGTVDSLSAAHAKDTQLIQQLNGEIALDEKQIADLQAALGGLTPAKVIALAPFTQQGAYGLYTPSGKLLGTGANRAA